MLFYIFIILYFSYIFPVKISVIIPVYNAEKYLSKCLESIINQTFKDIEIICINDGSYDKSEKIINKYAQKDKRIILFNQKNKGAGLARQKGIELLNGEYLSFIDSDDLFHYRTLEIAYENIKKYNSEVVWFQFANFHRKKKVKMNENIDSYEVKNFSMSMCWCCVVWNRVWKASIIKKNNIMFGKIISGQDNVFNAIIFPFLKNITILNVTLVYHRNVKYSLCSHDQNKYLNLFNSIPKIIDSWKRNDILKIENSEKIYYSLFNYAMFLKNYTNIFYKYLITEKSIFNKDFISNAGIYQNWLKSIQQEYSKL